MMKSYKLFAVLFCAFVLAAPAFGQDQDAQFDEAQFREPTGDGEFQFTPEQQEAMIEAQRAKLWGCYFLTKSKLYNKSDNIGNLIAGKNGEALFKKITADLMKNCLNQIQPAQSEKVFKTLNDESFNIDDYNTLLGYNPLAYQGEDVKTDLEGDEKFIYEYFTKIDDSFREQREEQAEKEEKSRRQKMDYEPQIGGISLKGTSPFVKLVYTAIVAGVIIVVFLFAYKKLFSSEETPYERVKRQKAERAEKKKGKAQ